MIEYNTTLFNIDILIRKLIIQHRHDTKKERKIKNYSFKNLFKYEKNKNEQKIDEKT